MAKIKTSKAKTLKELKREKEKKRGGENLIWSIPQDGITVRFLCELHEGVGYFEHWDGENYLPIIEGEEHLKTSERRLMPVVDRESDRVLILKIPASLEGALIARSDKYGTIKDRDYELIRSGTGLDTTYHEAPEPPQKFKFSKYTVPSTDDLELALSQARDYVMSQGEDEEEKSPKESKKKKVRKAKSKS